MAVFMAWVFIVGVILDLVLGGPNQLALDMGLFVVVMVFLAGMSE